MGNRTGKGLTNHDLRLVSIFMVATFLLIGGLEARYDHEAEAAREAELEDPLPTITYVTRDVLSSNGYTSEQESSLEAVTLDYEHIKALTIELTWTDDIGDNDLLRLTLRSQDEEMDSVEGSNGRLVIDIVDEEGGLGQNYTVEIEMVDCPGLLSPSPINRDVGNTWSLTVTATVSEDSTEDG